MEQRIISHIFYSQGIAQIAKFMQMKTLFK